MKKKSRPGSMDREPLNRKQVVLILALLVTLQAPMVIILWGTGFGRWSFSDRQLQVIGTVSIIVGVPTLTFVSRKWISKIKA
jgi:hypothetical protein